MMGRALIDDDEREGAVPVLVIGHREWEQRFAADPQVIGRRVRLGDVEHTVVGVMPPSFGFPVRQSHWIPLRLRPADYARGEGPVLYAFGRLTAGADLDAARAELALVSQRAATDSPTTHAQLRARVLPYTVWYFAGLNNWETAGAQIAVLLLLALIGTNVAVLVYARTATRRNEIAVRTALGASRLRIVGQMFVEGLVLSAIAAAVGLLIASIVRRQLDLLMVQAPFWVDATLTSGPVIRNVIALAVLGAVIVGVVPALQVTGRRARTGLQHAAATASRWKVGRTYGALVVVQVALAVAILPIAVATTRTAIQAANADPGFAADEFLMARLEMDRETPAGTARFRDRQSGLVSRLKSEPDVADVAFIMGLPGNDPNSVIEVEGEGKRVHQAGYGRIGADLEQIGVDALEPLSIPLLAGRAFDTRDIDASTRAVIVNRTFAQRILGGNAVGRRVRERGEGSASNPWLEVIGVIGDFPAAPSSATARAMMYRPVSRAEAPTVLLAVRVRDTASSAFATRLREIATGVDANLRLSGIRSMSEVLSIQQTELRLVATVSSLITVSVLLLSATGLYALMAFTVAQRRREIALRIALGANPLRLAGSIMSRAFWQLAIGTAIGSALTVPMLAEGEMTGEGGLLMLPPLALFVLVVGLLAAGIPARRGFRRQPTEALRED
jgi:predicted permease